MQTEVDIVRYNTSKKLAQLNKVIQYLTFHLEERSIHKSYLHANCRCREAQFLKETATKVTLLFAGIDEERASIEPRISANYSQRLETMQTALACQREAAQKEIQKHQNDLESQLEKAGIQVRFYSDKIAAQFDFLNDKTKADLSNIKNRVIQKKKDFQMAMKDQELAAKQKVAALREESRKKLKDMEATHKKAIEAFADRKDVKAVDLSRVAQLKQRISVVKQGIPELVRDLKQQMIVFQQNVAAFRWRLANVAEQLLRQIETYDDEFSQRRSEVDTEIQKMEDELKGLRDRQQVGIQGFKHEAMASRNELAIVRRDIKESLAKRKKSFHDAAIADKDLSVLSAKFAQELNGLKLHSERSEATELDRLEKLSLEVKAARKDRDFSHLSDQFKADTERQMRELTRASEHERLAENDEFERKCEALRHELRDAALRADFDQQLRKLHVLRDSHNRFYQSTVEQREIQREEDLRAAERAFSDAGLKIEEELTAEYQLRLATLSISDLQEELNRKYMSRKRELEVQHEEAIAAFQCDTAPTFSAEDFEIQEVFLNGELEQIKISRLPAEFEPVSDLRHRLLSLPDRNQIAKSQLIHEFEAKLEEEEVRHRGSLFKHLFEQRDEKVVQMDRTHIDPLDREIEALSNELRGVELNDAKYVFLGDPVDNKAQKLQIELEQLRIERKQKIRRAEAISQTSRTELQTHIEKESSHNETEIANLNSEIEALQETAREEYGRERQRRSDNAEKAEKRIGVLQNHFLQTVRDKRSEFLSALESQRQIIEQRQLESNSFKRRDEAEKIEARATLERELATRHFEFRQELEKFRQCSQKGVQELEGKIYENTKKRNLAKDQFQKKAMRKEEQSIIQKLERHLAIKTQQLATIGKELLEYRHVYILQEDEYNNRFGADPTVGVLAPKSPKKRPTTCSRKLPKLAGVA
jgi:intracellular sulfur oxidation DsrE/DsrF family protein